MGDSCCFLMNPNDAFRVRRSGFLRLLSISDSPDGRLFVAESGRHVPFNTKRTYFITDLCNAEAVRGKHAHRRLEQAIFCIRGAFTLELDDANARQQIRMEDPAVGVFLGTMLWHSMTA